jgi:hypothetical protein
MSTAKLPTHFMVGGDGSLFDTRQENWYSNPIRANYQQQHRAINTVADLKATLRAGQYAWPGGYPLYFITSDGAALSFQTVRAEFGLVVDSVRECLADGWQVVACDVNWEEFDLIDDHSGNPIESAYGEDN